MASKHFPVQPFQSLHSWTDARCLMPLSMFLYNQCFKTLDCRITTLVNALSGSLSSPGYPNQYPNNANCDYQITVPAPYTINLLLRNINMESCCDYLRVYDGTSTNASLVAAFNGNSAAGTQIQSTGNNLYITFQTDSSVTGLGFLADYRSGKDPLPFLYPKESCCK